MNKNIVAKELEKIASLLVGKDFPSERALKQYLKEHPKADRKKHTVQKRRTRPVKQESPKEKAPKKEEAPKEQKAPAQESWNICHGCSMYFTDDEVNALPDSPRQPAKTEQELFSQGEKAFGQLKTWLNRGNGVDKSLGLQVADISEGKMPDLDKPGGVLIIAPLKGKKRATEKVESDYGGDWSRLTDVVRASIAVDTCSELGGVMETLRKSGMKLAKKPKDRFTKPTSAGYRDIMMNVELPNGHIGELQVHVKEILKAKDEAHKLYEKTRTIEGKASREGRTELTTEEQKIVGDANKESEELYTGAFEKACGGEGKGHKTSSYKTAAVKY